MRQQDKVIEAMRTGEDPEEPEYEPEPIVSHDCQCDPSVGFTGSCCGVRPTRGPGRPTKAPEAKLSRLVTVRLTPEEVERLDRYRGEQSRSGFIRHLLNQPHGWIDENGDELPYHPDEMPF